MVHVRLAKARPFDEDDDELDSASVVATGTDSADLRQRVNTLMHALAVQSGSVARLRTRCVVVRGTMGGYEARHV